MRTSRWLAVVVVLGSLAAQEPPARNEVSAPAPTDPAVVADVRTRLRSEVLADVAWGGWLAGERSLRELAPDLRAALVRVAQGLRYSDGTTALQSHLAAHALLDGLIRIDAAVPAAELAPFLTGPSEPISAALLLLARRASDRDCAAALLDFFRARGASDDVAWLAAGNLLARDQSPEFVVAVLEGLELRLQVSVTRMGVFSLGFRTECRSRALRPRVPDSFPPIAVYLLKENPATWLIAPGRQSVWAERVLLRDVWESSAPEWVQGQNARLGWLSELVGLKQHPLRPRVEIAVQWESPEAYLEQVTAARAEIERSFYDLLDRLSRHGYSGALSTRVWGAPIAIEVSVHSGESEPLPPLPPEWEAWRQRAPSDRRR